MKAIAVVGLGYVGLPLVIEFAKTTRVIGFDIDSEKVATCKRGNDPSREIADEEMHAAKHVIYSDDPQVLSEADFIIVAVPTPVDSARRPDFSPLIRASRSVGAHMQKGTVVVFESTVYPGATEELCIPELEEASGMKWKEDFFVGYSPERINPGDREHRLANVIKVVSGDTPSTLEKVATAYERIVRPGVFRCSSIKVAEACKVIENTQRDLNIALMNELAVIFGMIGIDTTEVLNAAGTKWNFMRFSPGLVGGHCIGVDPYYLTHKAEMIGYHPQVILAGRRINDSMGKYIAEQTVKNLIASGHSVKGSRVNILGLTFKENCPDLRNSKVEDVIRELRAYGVEVFVYDPWASPEEALNEYGVQLNSWASLPCADAIVVAVAHRQFSELAVTDFKQKVVRGGWVIDVKSCINKTVVEDQGLKVWRL